MHEILPATDYPVTPTIRLASLPPPEYEAIINSMVSKLNYKNYLFRYWNKWSSQNAIFHIFCYAASRGGECEKSMARVRHSAGTQPEKGDESCPPIDGNRKYPEFPWGAFHIIIENRLLYNCETGETICV